MPRRSMLACVGGLGLLAACTGSGKASDAGTCFPVPAGAQVMLLEPGMEMQGTTLQGQPSPDGMQMQGTTLQGQPPPDGMQLQGSTLQGHPSPDGMNMQGTLLQGRPAALDMQNQGTTLQGGPTPSLMQMQGTHLQAAAQPRAYRGLGDLNGARMVIEADTSKIVTLQDGQLTAPGFADTASLRGTPITATAPDGRQFRVEVISITQQDATERIEIHVDSEPACQPGLHGVFVGGRWDAQAAHVDDPGLITYSCMDGVIAKCVDWGYAPWLTDASVHAGCTRMARADYCGNGTPWTLDGTTINVLDRLGIHTSVAGGDMKFEAAWSPSGAVCVAKSRYAVEDDTGRTVLPGCFANLPRCASLDDAAAQGAVLANQSRVMPIDACK